MMAPKVTWSGELRAEPENITRRPIFLLGYYPELALSNIFNVLQQALLSQYNPQAF